MTERRQQPNFGSMISGLLGGPSGGQGGAGLAKPLPAVLGMVGAH